MVEVRKVTIFCSKCKLPVEVQWPFRIMYVPKDWKCDDCVCHDCDEVACDGKTGDATVRDHCRMAGMV